MESGGSEEKLDYYSVLGCDPQSSDEQIRTEFKIRAKQTHPDKEGDTEDFQVDSRLNSHVIHRVCYLYPFRL